MRRYIGTSLAAALLLSACQGILGPTQSLGPRRTGTGVAASQAPKPHSPSPSSLASASPTAAPTEAPTPQASYEPTTLITGLIKIDADYVISAGGGNVISAGGGNVISAGGGNVISAGGGNVISAGGGNVISAGGGNVISAGGGNVISAGGGNYRTFDLSMFPMDTTSGTNTTASGTGSTAAQFPPGTMLPIEGMIVAPVSLVTGKLIGDAVKSDSTGSYQVAIPQSEKDNIRLFAAVPGKDASDPILNDPRLRYGLLTSQQDAADHSEIDEDSSLVTAYLRESLTARLQGIMFDSTDPIADMFNNWNLASDTAAAGPLQDALGQQLEEFRKAAQAAYPEHENTDPTLQQALSQRVMDILLAKTQVYQVALNPIVADRYTKQRTDNAIQVMRAALEHVRGVIDQKLQTDPGYFTSTQGLADLTLDHTLDHVHDNSPALAVPNIQKDTDFADYVLEIVEQNNPNAFTDLENVLVGQGANTGDNGVDEADEIEGASTSIVFALFENLTPSTIKVETDTIASFGTTASDTNQVLF